MTELNKAEKYLIENLTRLANEGCMDDNPRPKWKDGTPAYSAFISPVFETYDISKGETPITELRPIAIKSAIREIEWIYKDQSNDLKLLRDNYNIDWWNEFDIGDGSIGIRYGATVKKYDLMNNLLDGLMNNKFGRRHILSMWQNEDFKESNGLNPCCYQTMFTVRKVKDDFFLDMTLTSRSSDYLTAGHINRMQYLAFQMMIAKHTSMKVGKFNMLTQNLHVYDKHSDNAIEMLKRVEELKSREVQSQPKLILNVPDGTNFYDISEKDFELIGYNPILPQLKFELAV
ncbi:thymidylate synthase [Lysinibacillus sp. BPa_S21]|uniref:thymidylate synthase n=1 Tax=Lysinibacillus sp. BPa_S21 TaxID=2932478 RepID=UPI002010E0B3|nr:thymidylate synthase [Lysinibacillus sp. BPa_S21]MCL1696423.1 thymidylate synthase [Lysinibacillus sp. BPa_S21]